MDSEGYKTMALMLLGIVQYYCVNGKTLLLLGVAKVSS